MRLPCLMHGNSPDLQSLTIRFQKRVLQIKNVFTDFNCSIAAILFVANFRAY